MDRHRLMAGQVAHPPCRLPRRCAQKDALACATSDLDEDTLRVRLAGARKSREEHERPRTDELDDRPLLIRDFDRRPLRFVKQLGRFSAGALPESGGKTTLTLPEFGAVDAL